MLSEKERVRFIAAFMAFLSYSQNAFLKWCEGLLASLLWMGWQHVIMNLVGAPGGKPHPDAKPMGAFSIGGVSDKREAGEPRARPF